MSEIAMKNCIKNKNLDMFKMFMDSNYPRVEIVSYIIKGDVLKKKSEKHSLNTLEKISFLNCVVTKCLSDSLKNIIFEEILKNCTIYDQKELFARYLTSQVFKYQKVSESIINKITKFNSPEWNEILKLVLEKNKEDTNNFELGSSETEGDQFLLSMKE